jgi:hypothetical protein
MARGRGAEGGPLAQSFFNPGDVRVWIEAIRFDVSSPSNFASSAAQWLADAPLGAVIAGCVVLVAAMTLSRRPGMAALVVLAIAVGAVALGSIR